MASAPYIVDSVYRVVLPAMDQWNPMLWTLAQMPSRERIIWMRTEQAVYIHGRLLQWHGEERIRDGQQVFIFESFERFFGGYALSQSVWTRLAQKVLPEYMHAPPWTPRPLTQSTRLAQMRDYVLQLITLLEATATELDAVADHIVAIDLTLATTVRERSHRLRTECNYAEIMRQTHQAS